VVVPVHNEAAYVADALEELLAELTDVPAPVTVLVVENGSTDDTARIVAEKAAAHPTLGLLTLPDPDYGAAMRAGFLAGDGEWLVNFDIDYFSGAFLREVLAHAAEADLVLASKRAAGAEDRRSLLRRLATWTFNKLLRFLLHSRVTDTHGMKAVRREVAAALVPRVRSTQDIFDTELVLLAERTGHRIVEVPAIVEERRPARSRLLRRVPRTLLGLWRLRRRLRA